MKTANWLLLSAGALLMLVDLQTRASGPLRPVSVGNTTNVAGAGDSFTPSFSADGRVVVFLSHANNLVTNDDLGPYLDVFARDLTSSNSVLVSVSLKGVGGGNGDSSSPSISSNGQFVAFVSRASDLVNNDTNDASDIFVRNLDAGVTTLVSADATGTSSAGSQSTGTNYNYRLCGNPVISADGRWVVFESLATNLVTLNDANQSLDIFARDLRSNKTFLVSVNGAGTGSGNGQSETPSTTPDGRLVAFVSTSTDLVSDATNGLGEIYLRDLSSGTTTWVSRNVADFLTNNYRCFNPILSQDGQFVAFKATRAGDPGTVLVIRHALQTGATIVLATNSALDSYPEMSADGRFIASESSTNILVWDVQAGSNVLVNVNYSGTGPGNQPAQTPVMTPDGRMVVFLSAATDLGPNATNGSSQVFVRDLAHGTTRLLSANVDGVASSRDIDVVLPAISTDGRWVAFESAGPDLVDNDLNQANDVFLNDLNSGAIHLVSGRHSSLVPGTPPASSKAFPNSMSADGRYVAIASYDSDFARNDTNGLPDFFVRDLSDGRAIPVSLGSDDAFSTNQAAVEASINADGRYVVFGSRVLCFVSDCGKEDLFRRDLLSGTTTLVSIRADGTSAANSSSTTPSISSDGNLIAFQSAASDLADKTTFGTTNIFLRDMALGTNKLVSVNRFGAFSGDRHSFRPFFSSDDKWIVFASLADDLTTNSSAGLQNLFARNLQSNTTWMISVGPGGTSSVGYSRGAVFSADSRSIAFVTSSNSVAVYDLASRTSTLVCAGCDNPSISSDGRLVAYETAPAGASPRDIVVRDLQTGATNLISINRLGIGGGNGNSTSPLLSWDGRFVVFASKASDLAENDTNNASDIFVRDRMLGTTLLVSLNLSGNGAGNGTSSKPVLGPDGRTVVFQSLASDLVAGDYNDRRDVFVLRLGGPDTDGDGMDDDWEMAYFGTLARDGNGDFDGDGRTDLQEFLAGTDPTNANSCLRVMTLAPVGGGTARVVWSATPGKRYQVQFNDSLDPSVWNTLPGVVVASGTTASMLDTAAGAANRRYYRVVTVP